MPLIYERDDELFEMLKAGGGLKVFATPMPIRIPIHMHRDEEECRRAVEKWRAKKEKRRRILANVVIAAAFAIWAVALTWGLLILLGRF